MPATPPPAAAAPAAATAAPAAPGATAAKPLTVQQARAAGYKVVNESGRTLYCREDRKTGSHIRTEMVCLTPQELEAVREANKRNLEQMQRAIPPKQGG
jgi:predicted transglutaminase-like cysteine proteinase